MLNVFRMFGLMGGEQVYAHSSGEQSLDSIMADGVRGAPDIGAVASTEDDSIAVMVWNYHDDDVPVEPAPIRLAIQGAKGNRVLVEHFRVDQSHSNSYEAWKAMGSPQQPTAEQYQALERAGQLQMLGSPEWVNVTDGEVHLNFNLPRQGVSLVKLTW